MSNNLKKSEEAAEFHLDVTDDDYRGAQAKGINEDALLRPGRHTFRSRSAKRAAQFTASEPRKIKVRVNIYLDQDVINHFKERAAQPNAAPYQTQINQSLRETMERSASAEGSGGLLAAFDDERFIAALDRHIDKRVRRRSS